MGAYKNLSMELNSKNHQGFGSGVNWSKAISNSFEEEDSDYMDLIQIGDNAQIRTYLMRKNRLHTLEIRNVDYVLPPNVRSIDSYIRHVTQTNLFSLLFVNLGQYDMKQPFSCILFKKHLAWIDKGNRGTYRYFTRNKSGECRSFSIMDMLEIAYGEVSCFETALLKLQEILGCTCKEAEWRKAQQEKIHENLRLLSQARKDWKKKFPNLYKFTKRYVKILEALHLEENSHPQLWNHSFMGLPVTFVSTRHLQKKVNLNNATISQALNFFSAVGLIQKISPSTNHFPPELITIAENIRNSTKAKMNEERIRKFQTKVNQDSNIDQEIEPRIITFFYIPVYSEEMCSFAEKRALILLQANVSSISKINYKRISLAFGKEFADSLFIDSKKSLEQADSSKRDSIQEHAGEEQEEYPDDEIPF